MDFTIGIGSPFGNGKHNRPQRPAGPPEALLDLYEHLLTSIWSIRPGGGWPDLLPGQMPADLPVQVPLPDGARLVGSVRWADSSEVIFDCELSRDEVTRFYEQHLLPLGWTRPDQMFPGMGGGFTNTSISDIMGAYFCKGEQDPWLHIRIVTSTDQLTSVYVSVSTNQEQSPCSRRFRREFNMMADRMADVLPMLPPPTGGRQFSGGSSGGTDGYHSHAALKINLDVEAVGTHYSAQLESAGWTRTGGGTSGPLAWSAWDFKREDEDWHGLFVALAYPWSDGEYRLLLDTEAEGARRRRDMMFRRF